MLESYTRRYQWSSSRDSQIPSHGDTSYNRSWRLEILGQVLPRASPLPIFECTLICLRLGSSVSATEVMNQASFVVHVVACTHPRSTLVARLLHQARQTIRLCAHWKLIPLPLRPRSHGNVNGHFHLSWICKNAVSHFVRGCAKSSNFTNN